MKKILLKTVLLLCALVVGSSAWADEVEVLSWSRSSTSDTYTSGYTFAKSAEGKTGYYQDGSNNPAFIKLYRTSTPLFPTTPTEITFTAKLGGGTTKSFSSGDEVYVCFVDKDGSDITASKKVVTDRITTTTGSDFSVKLSTSYVSTAYGVKIYHKKVTSYNVRYYSFSLSYTSVAKKNTTLTLSPNPLNLSYGGSTGTLTATVTPEGESALASPIISWVSSNESVATVSNGVVSPVGEGDATITATYAGDDDYNGSSNTATVNVTDTRTAVASKVESIWSLKTLYIGGNHAFIPSVTLADGLSASDVTYSYVSADPTTIQINGDGTYTALKTGTNINITVTVTPIASKAATYKPVSATFQHNGAYKYSGLSLTDEAEFNGSKEITITLSGTQGPVYYTTNGNDPLEDESNRILYSDPFTITSTTTVKARVIDANGYYSTVQTATYTKVAANKDAITLAAGQSLSFTNFTACGNYGTNKVTYVIASDDDKYKWTGTDVGCFDNSTLQIKNNTSAYITSSTITAPNGFKMTLSYTGSVYVYVGDVKQTAADDGAYYFPSNTAVTLKRGTSSTPQVSNITFTGLKPSRTITFEKGDQSVTSGLTVTNVATASPAGTVKYSSSNTAVATVNENTGEVTGMNHGEATITATVAADESYEKSTGSYTVTVSNPFYTATFYKNGTELSSASFEQGQPITFPTSADIDGFTLKGWATAAISGIAADAPEYVTAANMGGTDVTYYAVYQEDDSQAWFTTIVNRTPVNITGFTYTPNPVVKGNTAAPTVTNNQGGWTPSYTYHSGTTSKATVNAGGTVTAVAKGTSTITVTLNINKTDPTYKAGTTNSMTFDITVINPSHDVAFYDNGTHLTTYDASVEEETSITFPDDPTPATGLEFIGWAKSEVGSTAAAPTTFKSANMGTADVNYYAVYGYVQKENVTATFDAADITNTPSAGTGTRTWKDSKTGIELYISNGQHYTSGSPKTWTANASDRYISVERVNCSIKKVEVTVSESRYSVSQFTAYEKTTDETGVDLTSSVVTDKLVSTLTLTDDYESVALWSGSSQLRATKIVVDAEISDVKGYASSIADHVDVNLNAYGYASYCTPFALDLTPTDNWAAWAVTSVSGTTITFTKIEGKVPAGTPFILYGQNYASQTASLPITTDATSAVAGNQLVGTLEPTVITADQYYGLKGESFVKVNAGTVPANKALLPANLVSGGSGEVKSLNFVFEDETTGIKTVETNRMDSRFYNLQGQEVKNPTHGIYIQNGKKVYIK